LNTDYSKAGNAIKNPTEGSSRIDISSIVPGYVEWDLNSIGLSWISKTGYTKLALREGHDILDMWPGYKNGFGNSIHAYLSEYDNISQGPYLEIVYR
jgi:hypothetical protein